MMTKITAVTALALLAACGSATVAEGDAAAQTASAAKPLTIAGVRIGMSADEAKATLVRDGWKVETFPGRDWSATVEEERRRQRGASSFDLPRNGVSTIQADKGDESTTVELRPVPSGAEVRFVKYEGPMAGRTAAQADAQLAQRYGPATVPSRAGAPLDATWCSGGERCRNAAGATKPAMRAWEDPYHKLRIALHGGVDRDRQWEQGVQRAAGAGKAAASSF